MTTSFEAAEMETATASAGGSGPPNLLDIVEPGSTAGGAGTPVEENPLSAGVRDIKRDTQVFQDELLGLYGKINDGTVLEDRSIPSHEVHVAAQFARGDEKELLDQLDTHFAAVGSLHLDGMQNADPRLYGELLSDDDLQSVARIYFDDHLDTLMAGPSGKYAQENFDTLDTDHDERIENEELTAAMISTSGDEQLMLNYLLHRQPTIGGLGFVRLDPFSFTRGNLLRSTIGIERSDLENMTAEKISDSLLSKYFISKQNQSALALAQPAWGLTEELNRFRTHRDGIREFIDNVAP